MQAVEKLFFTLLQNEVCGTPLPEHLPPLSGEALKALFALADRQDLAHLLYDVLARNELLSEDDSVYKPFSKAQMLAVLRVEKLVREEAFAKEALKKAGIMSLSLKGAVLRELYPAPWMRTGSDVDLLVPKDKAAEAERALLDTGKYTVYFRSPHDLSLVNDEGTHLELHRTLSAQDEESGLYSPLLDNIWERLTFNEDGTPTLPDDLFYCYHIFHMAVHVKIGGCGVRPLLDLWLLNHRLPDNKVKRDERLKEEGLLTFAKNVEKLSEVWFSSAESDEFTDLLSNFLLAGGVYGTKENAAFIEEGARGGKANYRLHKIFLPYRELKEHYPVLAKCPILFPFVSVFRWLRALSPKRRRDVRGTLAGGDVAEKKLGVSAEAFWQQVGLS